MTELPGFRFTKTQATDLVAMLQQCADLLNKSAVYAHENCDPEVAEPFISHIAVLLADLGWDVLEQGFYHKHPEFRPYPDPNAAKENENGT